MYTPKEYGEILRVSPNYDWGRQQELASEEQIAIKALMIFLLDASDEDTDIYRRLPAIDDREEGGEEIEVTVDRMVGEEYPIDEERFVVFDQLFTVDDVHGNGQTLFSKGYFSMSIMSNDYGEQGQYIFKVNPAAPTRPVEAEIYAGYSLDPESRVTSDKHLSALSQFLDRLLLIALRHHARDIVEYPRIVGTEPVQPSSPDS